jgi:hypothetical protein
MPLARTPEKVMIEHVSVLYEGQRSHMWVDEEGATGWRDGYPLPVNKRATEIYWEASRRGGKRHNYFDSPCIHGNAVLYSGIVVEGYNW